MYGSTPEVAERRLPLSAQLQGMPRLGFAYTRNAINLPSQQPGQLTFTDVILWGLPQGGTPAEIAAASSSGMMPPEAWTLLLWSVNRCVVVSLVPDMLTCLARQTSLCCHCSSTSRTRQQHCSTVLCLLLLALAVIDYIMASFAEYS
jgi:hypothetical protein